ncbi:MAG: hypothetical protein ABEL76_17465 [Bradymonadaceae bacterium]
MREPDAVVGGRVQTAVLCLSMVACQLAVVSDAAAGRCPGWNIGTAEERGPIEHEAVDESSGLVLGSGGELFWTHNDSGGEPQLFLFDRSGGHAGTVRLKTGEMVDWEDIARGPCQPGGDAVCLYVGDIGDNEASRSRSVIYKLREPDLPTRRPFEFRIDDVRAVPFVYPDGPVDAETLMVAPRTARLYVVEKSKSTPVGVYHVPNTPGAADQPVRAEEVGEVSLPHVVPFGRTATAGAISPDGGTIVVRSYLRIFTFCRSEGQSVPEALADGATPSPSPALPQAEAVAFGRSDRRLWLTSEKRPARLVRLSRQRDRPDREPAANRDRKSAATGDASDGEGCASSRGRRGAVFVLVGIVAVVYRRGAWLEQ